MRTIKNERNIISFILKTTLVTLSKATNEQNELTKLHYYVTFLFKCRLFYEHIGSVLVIIYKFNTTGTILEIFSPYCVQSMYAMRT